MFKKIVSLIMCLFIFTQTTSVFATSVSDLYGIKYTGDTEWKEEDTDKGKTPQSSTTPPTPVMGSSSDIKLNVNGNNINFPDQQPIVIEGRTFIPLRFLAEALGAEVNWDQEHQVIIIENKGIQWTESEDAFARYYLKIGDPQMVYAKHSKKHNFVSDIQIFELPQAPFLVNGRTMLPFRFVGELLGALVFYDDSTHTAMAVYGQHNLGAHLNSNYDNTTRKFLDMGPIPILSTLSENVFKEQLEIFRKNAPDNTSAYTGTTLNGELSAAATWKAIDESIAGYGTLSTLYGGHSNSDQSITSVGFFQYYLTNKYPNKYPNAGPYPDQYAENICASIFQPLTGIELIELENNGKLKKSNYSTINVDEVLSRSDYWYYRLKNVWGLNLFPLNDSTNLTIGGRNLSQYKINNHININGYPMFSFSMIKYWDKEMYRSYARSALITWMNSTKGHRKNLLRSGNYQFGLGTRYSKKESVYVFFTGPDKNVVLNPNYFN